MLSDTLPFARRCSTPDSPSSSRCSTYSAYRSFRGSHFRSFYVLLLFLLCAALILCLSLGILIHGWQRRPRPVFHPRKSFDSTPTIFLPPTSPPATLTQFACYYHNCFDVYRCGRDDRHRIKVYVYPLFNYVDAEGKPVTPTPMSREYHEMLSAIYYSDFITKNPDEACVFIPSIDLLNEARVSGPEVGRVLASLPFWNNGSNHLLFNLLPTLRPEVESFPDFPIGKAMVAGGSFSTWSIRRDFDVSLPIFNPLVRDYTDARRESGGRKRRSKKWLAASAQINIHAEFRETLTSLAQDHADFLLLDRCDAGGDSSTFNASLRCVDGGGGRRFSYPRVLEDATFCLVLRGSRLGQAALVDSMGAGCIPVVLIDHYVLPFEEVVDWGKAAIRLYESELPNLLDILHDVSSERISSMQNQVSFLWNRYLGSPAAAVLAALQIVNDRVFPFVARSRLEWNHPSPFPAFFPLSRAPKRQGFTAVILTFDRTAGLFKLVQRIAHTDSLAKIVVIWNNQNKRPPPSEEWPKLTKPLVVRETRENLLGNRFYPYEDIETEAVLALDDDINMLTSDELEFAYQVWSEHPDRLVGFPARLHAWDDNATAWRYESEWMNEISMVLTGAAFYHKYFSYLYTTAMPAEIRSWVDDHMNCEDIAMNFLVANYTGKAPIKVTPRKKFKCPNCPVNSLSYATEHMVERSRCVDHFARVYGRMPLKTVEFRVDPALFMDTVPAGMKKFAGIGSL